MDDINRRAEKRMNSEKRTWIREGLMDGRKRHIEGLREERKEKATAKKKGQNI